MVVREHKRRWRIAVVTQLAQGGQEPAVGRVEKYGAAIFEEERAGTGRAVGPVCAPSCGRSKMFSNSGCV